MKVYVFLPTPRKLKPVWNAYLCNIVCLSKADFTKKAVLQMQNLKLFAIISQIRVILKIASFKTLTQSSTIRRSLTFCKNYQPTSKRRYMDVQRETLFYSNSQGTKTLSKQGETFETEEQDAKQLSLFVLSGRLRVWPCCLPWRID